jgi:hypothetical protein
MDEDFITRRQNLYAVVHSLPGRQVERQSNTKTDPTDGKHIQRRQVGENNCRQQVRATERYMHKQ